MNLADLTKLPPERVSRIRAELETLPDFPFQVAHINLLNDRDPSAIYRRDQVAITIVSDPHSYAGADRIFPVNQDENTVFAQYTYRDSMAHRYERVLDLCTGSGVIAVALSTAGAPEVVAVDLNPRCHDFVSKNAEVNGVPVSFLVSDLFANVTGTFDKITINPPFMPAPNGGLPLHAQGGDLGIENVVEPFFRHCWEFVNPGGCVQGVFQSFARDDHDTILNLLERSLPVGWSYDVKHVFPEKDVPIELYASAFVGMPGYQKWSERLEREGFRTMRFFMVTARNDGWAGLHEERVSRPRIYNLIYPPSTVQALASHQYTTHLLERPVSETEHPYVGHLVRLARYHPAIYLTLAHLLASPTVGQKS
ncbi:methyltransferase [Candidatus Woesearchaeota archaeon]|nr:methyltransferase [Candidatus Woesearchaeota archaeon]